MRRPRLRTNLLTLAGVAAVLVATASAAGAATDEPLRYVALGDSGAAAPLVPPPDLSSPACLRSLENYPHVLAQSLGAQLTDVSCSGATLDHMTTSQFPGVAPQFAALRPDTDVVTLTIGSNDIGVATMVGQCVSLAPIAPRCADRYAGEMQARIDAWAPTLGRHIEMIKERSPRARIYLSGGDPEDPPGGCFPFTPMHPRDTDFVGSLFTGLSEATRQQAAEHGVAYIDYGPAIRGHGQCAPPEEKYYENAIPTSVAAPFHPNRAGSAAIGRFMADAIEADLAGRS